MKKELFIKSIEAIEKQMQYDISVAEKLAEVFPDSYSANLLPKNHLLQDALLEVLKVSMNDTELCPQGQSWIDYFCWELDFGKENYRLSVTNKSGKTIPMSNPGELWEFLVNGR
ncbi:hypothetical protein V6O07_02490 [Arthrospira platensis SPKY2]